MNYEKTFLKISAVRLTSEEIVQLLEDWDPRVTWDAPMKDPEVNYRYRESKEYNTFFLQEWINKVTVPPEAIEWLMEKHGKDMFLTSYDNTSVYEHLLLPNSLRNNGNSIVSFIERMDKNAFVQSIEDKLLQNSDDDSFSILGHDSQVKGDMAVILYFARYKCFGVIDAYLKKYPEALHGQCNGVTVGALIGEQEDGWKVYLKHGGSPFDKVHTHPISAEQGEDTPLWSWLMQRKRYHSAIENTMAQLLLRLSEGRDIMEGDYVLSAEDWQQLVESKPAIMAGIRMVEFENKINQDWKKAIKENKEWRKWRNSEEANFMFWLGTHAPATFIRQAHKTKLNHGMIKEEDMLGRTMMHYLLFGIMTEGLGSWRNINKLSEKPWEETLQTLSGLVTQNPQKGVMADWVSAETNSYFGKINKRILGTGNNERVAVEFLKDNPAYFWNGFKGDCIKRIFENPASSDIASGLMHIGGSYNPDIITNYLETLDSLDKFRLGVFLSGYAVYSKIQSYSMRAFVDIIEGVKTFPVDKIQLDEAQQMLKWIKVSNSSHYGRHEETCLAAASFLEKTVMHIEIYKNKSPEEAHAPAKKRLM